MDVFLARNAIDRAVQDAHCSRSRVSPSNARISLVVSQMQRSNTRAVTPRVPMTSVGCSVGQISTAGARCRTPSQRRASLPSHGLHGGDAAGRALGNRVSQAFQHHSCGGLSAFASASEAGRVPSAAHRGSRAFVCVSHERALHDDFAGARLTFDAAFVRSRYLIESCAHCVTTCSSQRCSINSHLCEDDRAP
jgi:hypothetical protein